MFNMTPVMEDYLERILILQEKNTIVRVKELADYFGVKPPSVVDALNKLKENGFIKHEFYSYITLTEKGSGYAKSVYSKHLLLKSFLHKILNLDEKTAEDDACKIEHYLSPSTIDKIVDFINFVDCPEGFPKWLENFYYFAENKKRLGNCKHAGSKVNES